MKGKSLKAIVVKEFPQMLPVFKEGDIIELEAILYDEDVITRQGYKYPVDKDGKTLPRKEHYTSTWNYEFRYDLTNFHKYIIIPDEIIPKGSYKNTNFIATDGSVYSNSSITNMIGYIPCSEWLKIIE